jgi:hypothetical protein
MMPPKQNPAAEADRVRDSDLAGERVDRENTSNGTRTQGCSPQQGIDFGCDIIRGVSRDLKAIDQHVCTVGTALAQGRLSLRAAINMVQQIVPGMIPADYLAMVEGVSPEQLRSTNGRAR